MSQKKLFSLALFSIFSVTTFAQTQLFIPDTLVGPTFDLNLARSTYSFNNGNTSGTMGVNGDILAPTLIFNKGDSVFIDLHNNLDEATTMHWHGMHVSPANDGGPHSIIPAGTTWSPSFGVLDNATTFWYHPHLHEKTTEHVTLGVAGIIIVRDEVEATLDLPRTYGVDDIPLIIQDRTFLSNGQIDFAAMGDEVMVNAVFDAYAEVPAQMVRLRLLNGSIERVYNIGFSDNRNFYQIGTDGGLLEAPVELNRVLLATGERAEIVVDLTGDNGEFIDLMSFGSEIEADIPGAAMGPGGPDNPLNGIDFEVLELRVGPQRENAVTSIPNQLVILNPYNEADADIVRQKEFTGGEPGEPFTIDDTIFNMNVINDTVYLDNTEIWELTNTTNTAHPFHIHDVQFYILDRDGQEPPANERGLKDVVLVKPDETVRFITKFEDFYDNEIPYMYHCHILVHEDGGMMGQFLVLNNTETSTEEEPQVDIPTSTRIVGSYPNPFNPTTNIRYHVYESSEIELIVYNMRGQIVQTLYEGYQNRGTYVMAWNASHFASGIYFVRLVSGRTMSTIKVVLVK